MVVTKGIPDAEERAEELKDFLKEREKPNAEQAKAKVTAVTAVVRRHQRQTVHATLSFGECVAQIPLSAKPQSQNKLQEMQTLHSCRRSVARIRL
jgi:hypothetical protein